MQLVENVFAVISHMVLQIETLFWQHLDNICLAFCMTACLVFPQFHNLNLVLRSRTEMERQAGSVQSERKRERERERENGVNKLFVCPPWSCLVLGALHPRSFFHNKRCHPCISISTTVCMCVSLSGCLFQVLLCRDLGKPREGSRAETLT